MKALATIIGIFVLASTGLQAQEECNPNPPFGMAEIAALSIYQGNYNNKDYPFALSYGRWMTCKKPKTMEGNPRFSLAREYRRIIDIYTQIGLSKTDPSEREAYIDTALALFAESFEIFTDEEQDKYELLQRRGRYYLENYRVIDNGLQLAYADFKEMFDRDPETTTTTADGYYVRILVDNYARTNQKEEANSLIDAATPYSTPDLLMFFDETRKGLFESPEEIISYYEPLLEENPNDIEALKALSDAYDDLNMVPELIEVLRKIHAIEPTFDSALQLADVEQGNAQYSEAEAFYIEALELAPTDNAKKEINLDLADVNISLERLQTAKRYIQAALEIDPNYGLALIKMAAIYAQAVTSCTSDRDLEPFDRVVYWVVIDYLNRAKNVDASVTSTVNGQLPSFEAVQPSTQDKFFDLGYENGQTVRVDASLNACYSWINESTTVR